MGIFDYIIIGLLLIYSVIVIIRGVKGKGSFRCMGCHEDCSKCTPMNPRI